MQIQIKTDRNIDGNESFAAHVRDVVEGSLSHFGARLTRVEVHVSDQNGDKGGANDKRCTMEARLEHHQPIAVSDEAATVHQAIQGAADKLKRSVEHVVGKLQHH